MNRTQKFLASQGARIAAGGLVVLALALALVGAQLIFGGSEAQARVEYRENGAVVKPRLSQSDALSEAEQKVGFPLRVPKNVPQGTTLKWVNAEVGPVTTAPDGRQVDLSHMRSAALYFEGAGLSLVVEQFDPSRKFVPASSQRLDVPGATGVDAFVTRKEGATTVTWVAADAVYVASLKHSQQMERAADQVIVATLQSMERP